MSDINERLKEACAGHPNAIIPWPHRLLHDAIDHILAQDKRLAELEAEKKELSQRISELKQLADNVITEKEELQQAESILNQRIAKLVAERRWIPVTEDVPAPMEYVNVFANGVVQQQTFYFELDESGAIWWRNDELHDDSGFAGSITDKWQPLPPAPGEGE